METEQQEIGETFCVPMSPSLTSDLHSHQSSTFGMWLKISTMDVQLTHVQQLCDVIISIWTNT